MYKVMYNEKAIDVINNNDKVYDTLNNIEDARQLVIEIQKSGLAIAAWIEEV